MARFTLPRDLYHGKGALEALKTFKGKKAMICVGGGSMKRFGFLARAEQYLKEGKTSAWYHYMSRPEFVEAEADKRVVHWASHLDTPVYLVHMADKEGLEECIKAKEEGHTVYVETCPQYLEFT